VDKYQTALNVSNVHKQLSLSTHRSTL